jgi:CubicO group peptidase (beta-lactamase class C family)
MTSSTAGQADATTNPVRGFVADGFESVAVHFGGQLADDPHCSAQFCAYLGGKLVADLWGGPDVEDDCIQGVFSATKGVSAVCVALLVERGLLDLDEYVSHYWPEFMQGGKERVTVRVALSHQAGLPGVEPQVDLEQLIDHHHMAARIAAQVPHWRPGSAHGYHALTIGTIMDELVRRIDGRTISDFFSTEIAAPRAVDFFIATPDEQERRVRDVLPALRLIDETVIEDQPAADRDTLTAMAFNAAVMDVFEPVLPNLRAVRAAGVASVGGAGSAAGLARLYATCSTAVDGFAPLLSPSTVAAVSQIQAAGQDLVLPFATRWGIVFQKPDDLIPFGSHQAFGHDGAGGAMGAADPLRDLAYGYVPRRMASPGRADPRGLALARSVHRCAASLER